MQRIKSFENNLPSLYLLSSPIGNLKDISPRFIEVINLVDYLYCEDTRITNKLLMYLGIKKELRSFHEHNKETQKNEIINLIKSGKNIGLISDQGTPCISDPGYEAVIEAKKENIPVISVGYVNAFIPALITSGIKPQPFLFYGFLDHKNSIKRKELEELKPLKTTLIFYEAPHRIKETLEVMLEVFGDRKMSISREISKIHEETITGSISEFIELDDLIGEMVLIVEGETKETSIDGMKLLEDFVKNGMPLKEASKKAASISGESSKELYNNYLQNK